MPAFTAGAWWDDFKLALKYITKWNKIAIVTDQKVIENNAIQMCAIVNKKHQLLEEMFSTGTDKIKSICQIPLLVFPFYDWFIS